MSDHYDRYNGMEKLFSTNLAEVGTDAVSRKAVKELAYSQIRSMYCGVALKEQRREDIENGNYMYNCSNCDCGDLHSMAVNVSYCWNCGADMREVTT